MNDRQTVAIMAAILLAHLDPEGAIASTGMDVFKIAAKDAFKLWHAVLEIEPKEA